MNGSALDTDIQQTLSNRARLRQNRNLLYWYEHLYAEMFAGIEDLQTRKILEIGSGTSPLKLFYPQVFTSDIMPLEYVDYVFDAHTLDAFDPIAPDSLDIITLTNVLHHLQAPLTFLKNAAGKLKHGGQVIFAEPYFSRLSAVIYTYLHYEPVDQQIETPEIREEIRGPLTTANLALPHLIFCGQAPWRHALDDLYVVESEQIRYYTSLAYMLTGGIRLNTHLPHSLFIGLFWLDHALTRLFPKMCASFFMLSLTKR